ncbi:hypothetical protein DSM03_1011218 [Leeuwenhoekiella aestuarii]|uniref:GLPGLI family protein n=1 Tax=Leeuwenhoekiella aestuarii TaxID=2249426 RepID=A0A4Q0P057_9FLAO|nr:hypothetical protein [Leeuwenhoekiella aestuarii]RXG18527.1 hypothetical protein DSM04_101729 [Leeuwenhoekiella aestuarii]RXG19832.1 hypothetical protein DSM03_1011218 [Leeuwenhoekiella aestuarii]
MASKILFLFSIILYSTISLGQARDTVYIQFNQKFKVMDKTEYQFSRREFNPEHIPKSYGYFIRQMEKDAWSDTHFHFSHAQRDSLTYKTFGGKPPLILKKSKSYLKDKQVLDINFFRTTPYPQICKTFEEEDSHEQDVVIFMIDEDEIKNDTLTLREVKFSRPVKQ